MYFFFTYLHKINYGNKRKQFLKILATSLALTHDFVLSWQNPCSFKSRQNLPELTDVIQLSTKMVLKVV